MNSLYDFIVKPIGEGRYNNSKKIGEKELILNLKNNPSKLNFALLGIVIGLSFLAKYAAIYFVISMLLLLFDKNMPLIIQEFIKTDFDVRTMVVQDKVFGSMKRKVIVDDFRSNVSLGEKAESIELTNLEKEECIKVSKMVKGQIVGVDFIPSKNRETEKPYFLEVW